MIAQAQSLTAHLADLSDPTRGRILRALEGHPLTVSELQAVLQLPQSTVSRHLKALADSGWVAARAEGTSNVYAMTSDDLDNAAKRLWALVREQVGATSAAAHDQRRVQNEGGSDSDPDPVPGGRLRNDEVDSFFHVQPTSFDALDFFQVTLSTHYERSRLYGAPSASLTPGTAVHGDVGRL